MLNTSQALADRLRLAVGRLARRLRQHSGSLTPSQRSVLVTLHHHGPLTMGRLADIEGVAPPSATRITDRLVEAGLVERRPHPDDGRSTVVLATAAGLGLLEEGRRERTAYLATRLERLTEDERRVLGEAAELMARMAEEE